MARLLMDLLGQIPGVAPLPVPEWVEVWSPWMVGFSIDPRAFRCSADEFGAQCAAGASPAPARPATTSSRRPAPSSRIGPARERFPYSQPPASRAFSYSGDTCPTAQTFLDTFIRWATFCEKYQPEHCQQAAAIVRQVADANRA